MNESILLTIKKMLSIPPDYEAFDIDVLIHINTIIAVLNQIGIGVGSFRVHGNGETWRDFLKDNTDLEDVKSYMYMRVRMLFDPPASGTHCDAMKNAIAELEWRLNIKEREF